MVKNIFCSVTAEFITFSSDGGELRGDVRRSRRTALAHDVRMKERCLDVSGEFASTENFVKNQKAQKVLSHVLVVCG